MTARPCLHAAAANLPTRNQEDNVTTTDQRLPLELIGAGETAFYYAKDLYGTDAGIRAAMDVAFAAGRRAVARDIRAVRDTRAADACCKGTGECGLGDCASDSAADSAFADAATIAETGVTR